MADRDEVSDAQLQQDVAARKATVAGLLSSKNKAGALAACLADPPFQAKNNDIKEANAEIVDSVLSSISDNEISGLVENLSLDLLDNLMKYVFKFMGKSTNCGAMLKFHAQIVDKAGNGCIVRSMTDRKTV